MSAILPHDLITIVPVEIRDTASTDPSDVIYDRQNVLHQLWKVHAVRYKVSRHDSDDRGRNLFWRTWSHRRLARAITTSTLTRLWERSQAGYDLSPIQIPATRFSAYGVEPAFELCRLRQAETQLSVPATSGCSSSEHSADYPGQHIRDNYRSPTTEVETSSTSSITPDSKINSTFDIQYRNLEPRTAGQSISETPLSPGTDDRNIPKSGTSESKVVTSRLATKSKDRTSFGNNTVKARTRPSLGRRKSSQSTSQQNVPRTPRSPRITRTLTSTSKDEEANENSSSRATTSTCQLPAPSSWEDEPNQSASGILLAGSGSTTSSLVVDKDFRNKFAEKVASSSNLAGMNRMKKTGSVVRFADELGGDKGKERAEDFARQRADSIVISEGESEEEALSFRGPSLPRTQSQLSLLISERRTRGDQSLELPESPSIKPRSKSKDQRTPTEEQKLLEMAHRDGVTKAGGIQLPPQQRLSGAFDTPRSSPSPEPLF